MAAEQTKKLSCGYCQGENDIPPFARVVTCTYCGSPNELQTGKVIQDHHMLSVYFSGSRLQELVPQYLSKFVGVPGDFADKCVFTKFDLLMMPFWLFTFEGKTDYRGIGKYCQPQHSGVWSKTLHFVHTRPEQGSIDLDTTSLIFGYKEQYRQIRDEKVPAGGKEAFDINAVNAEGGQIHDTEISYEDAYRTAYEQVRAKHNNLIYREIVQLDDARQDIKLKEMSYLHVPFYKVKYNYGRWEGEALVDASRGKVLRAEYPISRAHRSWGLFFIILALGVIGAAIYFIIGLPDWQIAGYSAAAIFLGVLIFGIKESVTKKKVAAE
ncbi:MAG: hypothetical protein FK733_02045 [Asgard group archaeon]|nr:hypothetical protein [Asgard group archaeon]